MEHFTNDGMISGLMFGVMCYSGGGRGMMVVMVTSMGDGRWKGLCTKANMAGNVKMFGRYVDGEVDSSQ